MFAPDGSTTGEIPQANALKAVQAGFKPAYEMTAPDGKTLGYIPADKAQDAVKAGFKPTAESHIQGFNSAGQPIVGSDAPPSTLDLYRQALFNPVGSGAHTQGVVGGLEQVGGQAAQTLLSPVMHPLDTAGSVAKTAASAIGQQFGVQTPAEWNPAVQAAEGFSAAKAQGGLPLALENAAGQAIGGVESGRMMNSAQEAVAQDSPGTISRVASGPVGQAAAKLFPSFLDSSPEGLLTKAIRPGKNNVNWNSDLKTAIPLMKSAEQAIGAPIGGVDDALAANVAAKKAIWQQYQARLGPAAAQGATIDGNQIADAMMQSVDARTAAQNPNLVSQIKQVADTYRRPMNLNEAEDYLQSTNRDLTTYYAKNKVSRQVAESDPEVAYKLAEADGLRSGLYGKLDQLSGPGAAQLKQAYGALTNVGQELQGRQLVAMRQNEVSLPEQIATARGVGDIAKGAGQFITGSPLQGIVTAGGGAADIATARALKQFTSSDSQIARAFKSAQPATPFPQPSFRAPSLPSRQLPAQSGAPTILPYNPQMSGGEQIAALMHYLRQNPQLALPAKASAIPLPPGTQ
jgi:hypothetical protein